MSFCDQPTEPYRSFSEHMASRVQELEASLRAARSRVRKLERSRDLWRQRALRKWAA